MNECLILHWFLALMKKERNEAEINSLEKNGLYEFIRTKLNTEKQQQNF